MCIKKTQIKFLHSYILSVVAQATLVVIFYTNTIEIKRFFLSGTRSKTMIDIKL